MKNVKKLIGKISKKKERTNEELLTEPTTDPELTNEELHTELTADPELTTEELHTEPTTDPKIIIESQEVLNYQNPIFDKLVWNDNPFEIELDSEISDSDFLEQAENRILLLDRNHPNYQRLMGEIAFEVGDFLFLREQKRWNRNPPRLRLWKYWAKIYQIDTRDFNYIWNNVFI